MSERKTFCAFGAYAVNVVEPAATIFMLIADTANLAKGIDKNMLVTLDLSKRVGVAAWDEAILDNMGLHQNGVAKRPVTALMRDDYKDGPNVLTVGPTFPGPHLGGIYIERTKFFAEIRPRMDPKYQLWPDSNRHTYEYMSSASRISGSILRYHGFHATVIKVAGPTIKILRINNPNGPGTVTVAVDLNDRSECDDPSQLKDEIQDPHRPSVRESVLTTASNVGDNGAIFLSLETCANLNLSGYKEPPGG
jgi:hypothetical protein